MLSYAKRRDEICLGESWLFTLLNIGVLGKGIAAFNSWLAHSQ